VIKLDYEQHLLEEIRKSIGTPEISEGVGELVDETQGGTPKHEQEARNPHEKPEDVLKHKSSRPTNPLNNANDDFHIQMLEFVKAGAKELQDRIIKAEVDKKYWRDRFMFVSIIILVCAVAFLMGFLILGIRLYVTSDIDILNNTIILSIMGLIIANVTSILVLFIKFVNDVKFLEMFKIMHREILQYLLHSKSENESDEIRVD